MIVDDTASMFRSLSHLNPEENGDNEVTCDKFVTASLTLSEIIHHAVRAYISSPQTPNRSGGPAHFLEPSTTEQNMAHVIRFDGSLGRWEESLPAYLKYGSSASLRDASTTRQAAVLHLR